MIDHAAVATAFLLWAGAVVSPGPAFAALVQSAVSSSRMASVCVVLGITAGSALYGSITLFGLLWIILHLGAWSNAVRWLGAAYLVWLGIQAWRSGGGEALERTLRAQDNWQAFGKGLLIELSNPKGIAFFLSVFAVSVPPGASAATRLTVLASGLGFELLWYLVTIMLFSTGPARQLYQRWRRAIARVFGLLFVSFGIGLALSPHR